MIEQRRTPYFSKTFRNRLNNAHANASIMAALHSRGDPIANVMSEQKGGVVLEALSIAVLPLRELAKKRKSIPVHSNCSLMVSA